ncbi:MAG: glycosyltransferase [Gammaproteobacteria bacterium]|nr:MAG: glycosyltransferase [Gammaproteobacteria bacterium]
MIPSPQSLATVSGTALAALAAGYTTLAGIALRRPANPGRLLARQPEREAMPAVTILKPLCGAEHGLYERLRSFCEQRYPDFQIVFGVRDPGDPALTAVRQLQRDFPALDLEVAADPSQHGTNAKVSNLINMMPHARHDYLVIADSDVQVPCDYLERVIAPLADEGVGIVTCPYRGVPRPGLWSLLGSMFVNEWFMPSVRVAALLGSRELAFGATIALRRESLERIGGFAALANRLADDYALGELTRQRGLTTVLSGLEVETSVDEAGAGDLLRHVLRWLRTIRAVRPVGYALSGITFGLPVAILGTALARGTALAVALLAVTAAARVMIDSAPRRSCSPWMQLWVIPLADLLAFALWCWSFATREVEWRHTRYRVARDGTAQPLP